MLRPKVSVIITGGPDNLRWALESVLNQTFQQFEVWVVTNHQPEAEQTCSAFSDPRVFHLSAPMTNAGDVHQIAAVLRRARGEFMAYLDSNDVWLPSHVETLVNTLEERHADVGLSIFQHVHSRMYSTVNIPILPDLPVMPDLSSLMHRKDILSGITLSSDDRSFLPLFIHVARSKHWNVEVSGVTTGLRFLSETKDDDGWLRKLYLEKLSADAEFVNKELSTILLRREMAYLQIAERHGLGYWIGRSWTMMRRFWPGSRANRMSGQLRHLRQGLKND